MEHESNIIGLFGALKFELVKIALINSILNGCIVFLILYLFLSFTPLGFMIPLYIALAYALVSFYLTASQARINRFEDQNPAMREILRTAEDNKNEDNIMVKGLFAEVMRKAKSVSSYTVINPKRMVSKVISIQLLVFVLIFMHSMSISMLQIGDYIGALSPAEFVSDSFFGDDISPSDDIIYGDARPLPIGDQEIQIEVNPSGVGVDISKIDESPLRENDFRREVEGDEGFAVADASYDDGITKKEQAIVKEYFTRINERD